MLNVISQYDEGELDLIRQCGVRVLVIPGGESEREISSTLNRDRELGDHVHNTPSNCIFALKMVY